MKYHLLFIVLLCAFVLGSCKEREELVQKNNEPLDVHRVSTIKIKNYVNRTYIDILGRNPTDEEMDSIVSDLEARNLAQEARVEFIQRLQTDNSFRVGDSSYQKVYYQRIYDMAKSKLLEGADDSEFTRIIGNNNFAIRVARLEGDSVRVFRALDRIATAQNVLNSAGDYRFGIIEINDMFARMANNPVYDQINMNTFNFINASFDDFFYRFPTQEEFDIAYEIIQNNEAGFLFGKYAGNKAQYCQVLSQSDEFYVGLIIWTYNAILSRDPNAQEINNLFDKLRDTRDFQWLQYTLASSDEYANF